MIQEEIKLAKDLKRGDVIHIPDPGIYVVIDSVTFPRPDEHTEALPQGYVAARYKRNQYALYRQTEEVKTFT